MSQQASKVAIVHDWLYGGGAEQVVYQLHLLYPEAPIYTSYCSHEWRQKLDNKVITGFLQRWPFNKLRKFVPFLRIWWFTHLDLSSYDLVISSSGAEAKGIKVPASTIHINYCHAPTHYYWSRYEEYLARPGFGAFDPLARFGLKLLVGPLRKWDYKAAQRPDHMIANSSHIQAAIQQYYNRDSTVIFPPVGLEDFKPLQPVKRHGFIVAGRQTPYKRFDIAVEACTALGLPLTVIGNGPDHARLQRLAGDTVTFVQANRQQLINYFQQANGFIFPGLDDFGIVAVEALAAGTPVIAYQAGGALDYIQEGQNGVFFSPQTSQALIAALKRFTEQSFDSSRISRSSERFSNTAFQQAITSFIADHTA